MSQDVNQQHPVSMYLKVWGWLFVLSFFSYMVDYMELQGLLRWSLILFFMVIKAGVILSVFMHVQWESLNLKLLLIIPTFAILVFLVLMAIEGDYTLMNRLLYYRTEG
ncbi:MAG: cytochrome C oxidase subunit IV family protein [Alkalimonas sp.]|uniref:Cytochrome C oxidase subunit IV family protein n=1 Tax=Alkalimonas delamerensis TaxID=265981 RepID=A0ABT9GR06_9GAMM|nr:cytochrome C oxidase subunit IV family protein [Alkalimonas delamerensis]MCC5851420.1 cytochrome C oxidase subunit IV family protein [Alkalimonas sp.]MDP4529329.1 cytochrome C oxidase subunit IV family protein [Alkalimonas delamerensis]